MIKNDYFDALQYANPVSSCAVEIISLNNEIKTEILDLSKSMNGKYMDPFVLSSSIIDKMKLVDSLLLVVGHKPTYKDFLDIYESE